MSAQLAHIDCIMSVFSLYTFFLVLGLETNGSSPVHMKALSVLEEQYYCVIWKFSLF